MNEYFLPLVGGCLIGLAASLMLLWNGRVTGISGIVYGAAIKPVKNDSAWRRFFMSGLLIGGFILRFFYPDAFSEGSPVDLWNLVVAGLLVGFGTILGNGCTSGHGVCGISRLSLRSMAATITFIMSGFLTVFILRHFGILP